jgi:hypothetical protein
LIVTFFKLAFTFAQRERVERFVAALQIVNEDRYRNALRIVNEDAPWIFETFGFEYFTPDQRNPVPPFPQTPPPPRYLSTTPEHRQETPIRIDSPPYVPRSPSPRHEPSSSMPFHTPSFISRTPTPRPGPSRIPLVDRISSPPLDEDLVNSGEILDQLVETHRHIPWTPNFQFENDDRDLQDVHDRIYSLHRYRIVENIPIEHIRPSIDFWINMYNELLDDSPYRGLVLSYRYHGDGSAQEL